MILVAPRSRQGGGAGEGSSARSLGTHPCPRAVPVKGYTRERQCSRGSELRARRRGRVPGRSRASPASAGGRRARVSNQARGLPGHWPRTAVRAHGRNAVHAGIGSKLAQPTGLELGVGLPRAPTSCRHKFLHAEGRAPGEHVGDRPAELMREDRQGFALARLPLEALIPLLAGGILAEE